MIDRLQINKIHKRHRPAKYRTEDLVGWSFPNTIWVPGTDYYGNTTTYPKEATILTVDGLLHSGKSDSKKRPRIDELRLIIEMARKYAQIKHLTWRGPGNGYDLRPRA